MSKYTIELGEIAQSITNMYGDDTETIIQAAIPLIFNTYPIFDETYRNTLNTAIMSAFFWREIGFETYGRWKFELHALMNRIMPYYNKLYESTLIEYNPIITYFETRNEIRSGSEINDDYGNNNETSSSTSNNKNNINDDYIETDAENNIQNNTQNSIEEQNEIENNNTDDIGTGGSSSYDNKMHNDIQTQKNIQSQSEYNNNINVTAANDSNNLSESNYNNTISGNTDTGNNINKASNTPQNALNNLLNDRYLTTADQQIVNQNKQTSDIGVQNRSQNNNIYNHQHNGILGVNNNNLYGDVNNQNNNADIGVNNSNQYQNIFTHVNGSRVNNGSMQRHDANMQNIARINQQSRQNTGKIQNHNDYILSRLTGNNRNRNYQDGLSSFVTGKTGSQSIAELIMQYRASLINVDSLIIEQVNYLFMLIY